MHSEGLDATHLVPRSGPGGEWTVNGDEAARSLADDEPASTSAAEGPVRGRMRGGVVDDGGAAHPEPPAVADGARHACAATSEARLAASIAVRSNAIPSTLDTIGRSRLMA